MCSLNILQPPPTSASSTPASHSGPPTCPASPAIAMTCEQACLPCHHMSMLAHVPCRLCLMTTMMMTMRQSLSLSLMCNSLILVHSSPSEPPLCANKNKNTCSHLYLHTSVVVACASLSLLSSSHVTITLTLPTQSLLSQLCPLAVHICAHAHPLALACPVI